MVNIDWEQLSKCVVPEYKSNLLDIAPPEPPIKMTTEVPPDEMFEEIEETYLDKKMNMTVKTHFVTEHLFVTGTVMGDGRMGGGSYRLNFFHPDFGKTNTEIHHVRNMIKHYPGLEKLFEGDHFSVTLKISNEGLIVGWKGVVKQ